MGFLRLELQYVVLLHTKKKTDYLILESQDSKSKLITASRCHYSRSCLQNRKLMMSKFLTLESANILNANTLFNNRKFLFTTSRFFVLNNYLHEFQLKIENCFTNECEMIGVSKKLLRITGPSQGLKIRRGKYDWVEII